MWELVLLCPVQSYSPLTAQHVWVGLNLRLGEEVMAKFED